MLSSRGQKNRKAQSRRGRLSSEEQKAPLRKSRMICFYPVQITMLKPYTKGKSKWLTGFTFFLEAIRTSEEHQRDKKDHWEASRDITQTSGITLGDIQEQHWVIRRGSRRHWEHHGEHCAFLNVSRCSSCCSKDVPQHYRMLQNKKCASNQIRNTRVIKSEIHR